MLAFHLRFVGATELPRSLSESDVEQLFRLSSDAAAAIRKRFRSDLRLGVSVQLVFLRATGRPLDRMANILLLPACPRTDVFRRNEHPVPQLGRRSAITAACAAAIVLALVMQRWLSSLVGSETLPK